MYPSSKPGNDCEGISEILRAAPLTTSLISVDPTESYAITSLPKGMMVVGQHRGQTTWSLGNHNLKSSRTTHRQLYSTGSQGCCHYPLGFSVSQRESVSLFKVYWDLPWGDLYLLGTHLPPPLFFLLSLFLSFRSIRLVCFYKLPTGEAFCLTINCVASFICT